MKPTRVSLRAILIGALLLGMQGAPAQEFDRQYVTDRLRLSLYSQADQSSDVIKLLQSGDMLEIEQIQGQYAFVSTEDGTRGWVKRGFLVTDRTSNLLLEDALGQIDQLETEIAKLNNSKVVIDQYEQDMDKMAENIGRLEQEKAEALESLEQIRREQAEAEAARLAALRDQASDNPAIAAAAVDIREIGRFALDHWKFLVPMLAILILVTYLVSKTVVESRIKAKFHGIKIW